MKANNGSGNKIERDEWETPRWLFDFLNNQYGFRYDCCANYENRKCRVYADNFLSMKETNFISWMNPPFSKAREMFEHFFKTIKKGVAIYRCDNMETKIWQDIILRKADWIFIPNKRISYEGMDGKGSRFPSALIGIGVIPIRFFPGITLFIRK